MPGGRGFGQFLQRRPQGLPDQLPLAVLSVVAHAHAPVAASAVHQPGRKRGAAPDRAHGIGTGTVGRQLCLVRLELGDGDVGGQDIRDHHMPSVPGADDPPGARPGRVLAARVDPAPPVGVDAGIGGIVQQGLQRHPVRPAPFPGALVRTLPQPDAQLDVVLDEIAQHTVQRAEPLELREDRADTLCTCSSGSKATCPDGRRTFLKVRAITWL
jgi:hypothetical protein